MPGLYGLRGFTVFSMSTFCHSINILAAPLENMSLGFLTRYDTNQVAEIQKMARVEISELRNCTTYGGKQRH